MCVCVCVCVCLMHNFNHPLCICRPLKFGREHQSAPFLYAKALSALQLEGTKPLQFLNVGSGTGYLQALVANMLPRGSLLHGIELDSGLSAQAEERYAYSGPCRYYKCARMTIIDCAFHGGYSILFSRFGRLNEVQLLPHTTFSVGNIFDIDTERNILYDRCVLEWCVCVWVGVCCVCEC